MQNNSVYLGIDAGSTTVKAVVTNDACEVLSHAIERVSGNYESDIALVRDSVITNATNEHFSGATAAFRIAATAATGYGQALVGDATRTISEISCHARGAHTLHPDTRVVIDIGGQDMKIISVNPIGKPIDFLMNDKCAAGTGRFLDVMARALGVDISQFADLAETSGNSLRINSMCTVFAESEVISLLSRGAAKSDVANGLLDSIAERVASMVRKLVPAFFAANSPPHEAEFDIKSSCVVVTGGGALNRALVASLSRRLNHPIVVPNRSQLAGALGAALFARDSVSAM